MKQGVFEINNRFIVDPGRNTIRDTEKDQTTRVEPRLMRLLCLLAAQPGENITREYIVKEIWNNYPGAGEGLNQAVSFLRKLLDDGGKEMIRTQPKSGYSFHADLSYTTGEGEVKKSSPAWIKPIVIGTLCFLLLLLGTYFFIRTGSGRSAEEQNNHAELSKQDSIRQAEMMKQSKEAKK